MTTTVDIGTLISRTPGLHGGVLHISGKGVTVRRIISWYKRGLAAEDIGDRIRKASLPENSLLKHVHFSAAIAPLWMLKSDRSFVGA